MSRAIGAAAAIALAVVLQERLDAGHPSGWTEPENLGAAVNTPYDDMMGAFSKDGLILYFTSTRPDGAGGEDIWVSQRTTTRDPFGAPVNLAMINTAAQDRTPTLSRDGHWLYFASNRPGGAGGLDIWASYRADTHDVFAWEPPVNLGPGVNIATGDTGPAYLAGTHGCRARLYFARGTTTTNTDIYVSEQAGDGTWLPAVPVAEVNSDAGDANPDLSVDGRVMLFHSTRAGTVGAFDNWVATRRDPRDPFSPPVRLAEPLNGPTSDRDAAFSRHGDAIVISSDRPGGYGLLDLYISRRER